MSVDLYPVFSIGHSTHSLDAFVSLLELHEISAMADVRSSPYSRLNPQFNREALAQSLKSHGIAYVFLGRELGGRSDDPSFYQDGRVQYSKLAMTEAFQSGLERVLSGAATHRIALMCAEKEPLDCHRTLLVARALCERGADVRHILADGRLESHEATMDRLLELRGRASVDLFRSRQELIADAIAEQEKRVAYVNEGMVADAGGDTV